MKFDKSMLRLYAITDRHWLEGSPLAEHVELAVRSGVTMVQIREKDISRGEYISCAEEIKSVTDKHNIPFIVNDDVDVALACGADGVHVGQDDMNARGVRRLVGADMILGVSARTVEEAVAAEKAGANYLGVGAVFPTATKDDARDVDLDTLAAICAAVSIPVVAIGGITAGNIMKLSGTGISGVSVISAIFARRDIAAATTELRALADKL
ncbi:MAG: thiamine phosphate synthase [Synergistaceae bacterium]|nr:thiamine phosphate synthase [Synergistaceae bacterium]